MEIHLSQLCLYDFMEIIESKVTVNIPGLTFIINYSQQYKELEVMLSWHMNQFPLFGHTPAAKQLLTTSTNVIGTPQLIHYSACTSHHQVSLHVIQMHTRSCQLLFIIPSSLHIYHTKYAYFLLIGIFVFDDILNTKENETYSD